MSLIDSVLKNVKARRILERSLDYVMYQFANQEKILIEAGKEKEVQLIKDEIKNLVALAQELYL